jgi:uncharacterized protein (TIGR02246 family)
MTEADAQLRALEARVRRMEDLEEIRRLYVDYGRHLDDGDAAAYAILFARDAKLRLGSVMRADGREAIEQAAAAVVTPSDDGPKGAVHLIDAPRLELDGDTASGMCVWAAVSPDPDGVPRVMVGRHVDELVREDGHWRFASRKGFFDVASPHS